MTTRTPSNENRRNRRGLVALLVGSLTMAFPSPVRADADAGSGDSTQSVSALKLLSLEQLMGLEVTSVSKRPEKLTDSASAIQVVTGEDIRRSGATSIPEALRLAGNLDVAEV